MQSDLRVGVFDSGIGGLTVLRECVRWAPCCRYYYLGDNRRAPYGSRPPEEIFRFVRSAFKRFERMGVDAAVLACNTATAVCAERLREEFGFPIVGTEPAVKPAARVCKNALVLATPRTAESKRLETLIRSCPRCRFTVFAPKDLAAAVERYASAGEKVRLEEHLPRGEYDGVVLGCTHYVFLKEEISSFYRAVVWDGNEGVARRLRTALEERSCEKGRAEKKVGRINHFCLPHYKQEECVRTHTEKNIFFIGSSKKCNFLTYEHMFVSKTMEKCDRLYRFLKK